MDWGDLYDVAVVGWEMAPSEFWRLTPAEFWRIHECKRPRDQQNDYAGSLTESELDELWELKNGN